MTEKTKEKFERVRSRINDGETVSAACSAETMGVSNYYSVMKLLGERKPGMKTRLKMKKHNKTPAFVDVPLKATSTTVAIVITTPENIKAVLAGLQ